MAGSHPMTKVSPTTMLSDNQLTQGTLSIRRTAVSVSDVDCGEPGLCACCAGISICCGSRSLMFSSLNALGKSFTGSCLSSVEIGDDLRFSSPVESSLTELSSLKSSTGSSQVAQRISFSPTMLSAPVRHEEQIRCPQGFKVDKVEVAQQTEQPIAGAAPE